MNKNIHEQLNDLIEYKRLVIKLEDELKKKSLENAIVSKQNTELKSLCQDLQIECDELNKKLISKNSEMKKLDKKYKDELENVSQNFEKQKEIYEEKILKLSAINPVNKEISIKREVEVRFEEKLKEKNEEIEILNNKIKNLNDENYDLRYEIERIKSLQNKFNILKEEKDLMEDLVRQEDNQKEVNPIDNNNDKLKEMQFIIREKEENIEKLYQEINKLKNEKNLYEINLSKKYFLDLSQLTEMENENNFLKKELSKKDEAIKNIENRLLDVQKIAEKINKENEEMAQENNNLITKINELEKEKQNNSNEIQKDLDCLRELVQNYETEQHNNSIINEKIKKQNEEKNKNKINELEKKLEEEKERFSNYVESNNFKSNNNYINIIEYKNNEQTGNTFKNEYEKIRVKYNLLLVEQKRMKIEIQQKEEENESLNKYLKEAANKEKQRKEKYSQIKEKYKILLDKKEHYKELCKISKKNMENLINLMNPELKKSIESSENKYLIDTDSFSFTET